MNRKTVAVVAAGLMLVAVAAVIYVAPVFARLNGTTTWTRNRTCDRLQDPTCSCDCVQTQNQTCVQLRLHECQQNQTCAGPGTCRLQAQYQYRLRHQHMPCEP